MLVVSIKVWSYSGTVINAMLSVFVVKGANNTWFSSLYAWSQNSFKSITSHQPDDSFSELQAVFLLSTDILILVLFVKTEIIYPIVSSQARAH